MAKLNICKAEVIEVEGVQYRRVEREVREGDIVQANEHCRDITYGGFYAVDSVDGGYFTFIDDDGDERTRRIDDDDFVVYEKVTEAAKSESDELFTYEGVQYRKVKRKAAAGERVLIIGNDNDHRFDIGEVITVTRRYDEGGLRVGVRTEAYASMVRDYDYVVLEPVKSAEPPKQARIPVGTFVRVTDREQRGWVSIAAGSIGKITEDDGKDFVPYQVTSLSDRSNYGWYEASELTLLTEAEAKAAIEAEEKRQQAEAERAKWAAIGRKVNEYKAGDVVKCVGSANAGYGEVLKEVNERYSVKYSNPAFDICAETTEIITLIVPVEQRFDRKANEGAAS